MPRKPNVDRPVYLQFMMPESIRAWLDLYLFSPLEGRVPKGRYQEFLLARIQEYRTWKKLDLTPFGLPGTIAGPKDSIDALERKLNNV